MRMHIKKISLITGLFLYSFSNSQAQIEEEFVIHMKSLDEIHFPRQIYYRGDSVLNGHRAFVGYIIKHFLEKPEDKYFISNRNLLQRIPLICCDSLELKVRGESALGEIIQVHIKMGEFEPQKHTFVCNEDTSTIHEIDGAYPFGGQYGIPEKEIKEIEIQIGEDKLSIPPSAYANLFAVNSCDYFSFIRPIEVYSSLSGQYLYVYLYGGNAAGTWFGKLIFNQEKYLSRIVTDYIPLSIHGMFGSHFIGF